MLSLLAGASAWSGSTLAAVGPAAAARAPTLVFAPNTVPASAKLPVVLLLHSRCENALGADANFHFANLVDQARAARGARVRAGSARAKRKIAHRGAA